MIAYLDCFSGVSGDMLLGALVDAGLSLDDLRADLSHLSLSGYQISAERVSKRGISGTRVSVRAEVSHEHRGLADIVAIIERAELPREVVAGAVAVFTRLAEAEAAVHGQPVEKVHFHEVGAVDAIVDIVGTCCGLRRLGIGKVYVSPLPLGGGWVESAHGRLPVPAPATSVLVKGAPTYGGPVDVELVTPTGAAIVTTIAEGFGAMPPMAVRAIGWGAGAADLPHPNLLRIFLGDPAERPGQQHLVMLETNVDDMNAEFFDHVMERLFGAGALDVFYTPIIMKKSRPAVLVSVLADPGRADQLSEILFRETTTLGVRRREVVRHCLDREWREVETPYGNVRVKIGLLGGEEVGAAPEYEDCRRLAGERGVPVMEVYQAAQAAFRSGRG